MKRRCWLRVPFGLEPARHLLTVGHSFRPKGMPPSSSGWTQSVVPDLPQPFRNVRIFARFAHTWARGGVGESATLLEISKMTERANPIIGTGEATGILPAGTAEPVIVIGTKSIRESFDERCLQQAVNTALAPGVVRTVLNPDGHAGYGAPIGCVMASPTHIYPGPVGVDIKCSMSLLQTNIPNEDLRDRGLRRALIEAICDRTPTGAGRGQRSVKKSRRVSEELGRWAVVEGASQRVCEALGIPPNWADRCEDSFHVGHDGTAEALGVRLDKLIRENVITNFDEKAMQLGSYGGGNHFGECERVTVASTERATHVAERFGILDNHIAFLSHCGSRGIGHALAMNQFRTMQERFARENIPLPGDDKELVYAELGTELANDYLDDMALGANFATVNHMLINALVLEAFQELIPGCEGWLVYFISHNIARFETVDGMPMWVHRKGATRAFPAGHPELKGTLFEDTGHPILLPGNPVSGSAVMVAEPTAKLSLYSVNHGAGRTMGRKHAVRTLDQSEVDQELNEHDVLSNQRRYPRDEAPAAYKDFKEVLRSVELAGLATQVASLSACFVIKDAGPSDD